MQLGLGAAAITRFSHGVLRMRTTAVELNPTVIAACRRGFACPTTTPRLEVLRGRCRATGWPRLTPARQRQRAVRRSVRPRGRRPVLDGEALLRRLPRAAGRRRGDERSTCSAATPASSAARRASRPPSASNASVACGRRRKATRSCWQLKPGAFCRTATTLAARADNIESVRPAGAQMVAHAAPARRAAHHFMPHEAETGSTPSPDAIGRSVAGPLVRDAVNDDLQARVARPCSAGCAEPGEDRPQPAGSMARWSTGCWKTADFRSQHASAERRSPAPRARSIRSCVWPAPN